MKEDSIEARPCRINELPPEILTLIFWLVKPSSPWDLAAVSRLWREAALPLWRDTRFFPSDKNKLMLPTQKLLSFCAEHTHNTITHVDTACLLTVADLVYWLKTCRASRQTIRHFDIEVGALYAISAAGKALWELSPQAKIYTTHVLCNYLAFVFELLTECAHVESVRVDLSIGFNLKQLNFAPPACAARPKTVTFHTNHTAFRLPEDPPAFFEQIAAAAEFVTFLHFWEDDGLSYEHAVALQWNDWAWTQLLKRVHALQSFKFSCLRWPSTERIVEFPHLGEAMLHPPYVSSYTAAYAKPRMWCRMPLVQDIASSPTIAVGIDAPQVRRACLYIRREHDLELLQEVLLKWPHLESMTLALYNGDWKSETQSKDSTILSSLLAVLTPDSDDGMLVPGLRHLGVLVCPKPTAFGSFVPPDINWAWYHRRWTAADIAAWRNLGEYRLEKWTLAQDLIHLVQERRRRSAQQPPSKGAACASLETIKLGGVPLDGQTWQALTQSSDASIWCYPDPTKLGEEEWAKFGSGGQQGEQ